MGAVNQFLVLKRDNKWAVKSGDLEKLFSTQREAVDAAIRLASPVDSVLGAKSCLKALLVTQHTTMKPYSARGKQD